MKFLNNYVLIFFLCNSWFSIVAMEQPDKKRKIEAIATEEEKETNNLDRFEKKSKNLLIILCTHPNSFLPVCVSQEQVQLFPTLVQLMRESDCVENSTEFDFSNIFQEVASEIIFIKDLLEQLVENFQNKYALLSEALNCQDSYKNDKFCWSNISTLRHALYEFCKKNPISKSVALSRLAALCKKLQLHSLEYFFDIFTKNVTKEQLHSNAYTIRDNVLKNLWARMPQDLKFLVQENILTQDQKELLIEKIAQNIVNLTILSNYTSYPQIPIDANDHYIVECSYDNLTIYNKNKEIVGDIEAKFDKISLYKNKLITRESFDNDEESIVIRDIENNNSLIISTAKCDALLRNHGVELAMSDGDSELSIDDFAVNKKNGELIILCKAEETGAFFLLSYSFINGSLHYLSKETELLTFPDSMNNVAALSSNGLMASISNQHSTYIIDFFNNKTVSVQCETKITGTKFKAKKYKKIVFFLKIIRNLFLFVLMNLMKKSSR